jgi:putative transposase
MEWTPILAYIIGTVDQESLLRDEQLAAENRILMAKLNGCPRFSDVERATLGEIGFRVGRRALSEVATAAQPDTIWRDTGASLLANSMDRQRGVSPGRPRIERDVQQLIIRIARENRSWGYDRIVGPSPILDTMSTIRRSAMCCAVTVYRRRRNANVRPPGGIHSDCPR